MLTQVGTSTTPKLPSIAEAMRLEMHLCGALRQDVDSNLAGLGTANIAANTTQHNHHTNPITSLLTPDLNQDIAPPRAIGHKPMQPQHHHHHHHTAKHHQQKTTTPPQAPRERQQPSSRLPSFVDCFVESPHKSENETHTDDSANHKINSSPLSATPTPSDDEHVPEEGTDDDDDEHEPCVQGTRGLTLTCGFPGCGQVFVGTRYLKQHALTQHNLTKPFSCTVSGCLRAFSHLGDLTRHKMTHTGERPFVCVFPDCGKSFSRKFSLKRHLTTHSNAVL